MENIERVDAVKYELFSEKYGSLIIQEPKGYSNDTKSYERDKDSRGITSKVDIDLEFYGNGAEYLRNAYKTTGIQEKILLVKYEKSKFTLTEEWTIRYIQELDLGTYKEVSRTGSIKVNSTEGGLYSDIKNRISDEYDLLENSSADGVDIGELITEQFQPLGRKIFLESLLKGEATDFRVNSRFRRSSGGSANNQSTRPIPLEIVYNSSTKDIVTPFNGQSLYNEQDHNVSIQEGFPMPSSLMFFYQAELQTTLSIKIDLSYVITSVTERNWNTHTFRVALVKIERTATQEQTKEVTVLQEFAPKTNLNILKQISYPIEVTLETNESLALVFNTIANYSGDAFSSTRTITKLNVLEAKVVVEDITDYTQSVSISKCIKPINLFDRLVAKITGKTGLVKSNIFGAGGEYEFMVVDNGLWARGFPDVYQNGSDEDQKIQIKTSLKDAFESFNYLEPLCWFTEIIGNKEYFRIEKATYTQQGFIGVSLGDVDKIEYESSKPDYFSTITIGHDRSMEYEEINGLDETNGKSEFTTFITKNISKYEAVSKYRTDAVGYELTRRLPFSLYPKEDSKRDNDLWIHDAKLLNTGIITHKKWDDRFDSLPIGIYDPESSWNLWLSPINRLFYGHGYSVIRGLYHYPTKNIKFNSSNANQNLITIKDGFQLNESGSLQIKDIKNPKVEATLVNFTFKMTQELENIFNGFKEVGNDKVPNYFGLIEYTEKGETKYGRLVKLESSEEAKITLIKARV